MRSPPFTPFADDAFFVPLFHALTLSCTVPGSTFVT